MELFKDKKTGEVIKTVYYHDIKSASEIISMLAGEECEAHLEDGVLFIYEHSIPYGVYVALDSNGVQCISIERMGEQYTTLTKPNVLKTVSIVFEIVPRIYHNLDDYIIFLSGLRNSVPEQYRKNIIISVESVDDSDLTLNMWFKRPETPEETFAREEQQKKLEAEQRERDLKEFRRIINKYKIKNIDDFINV